VKQGENAYETLGVETPLIEKYPSIMNNYKNLLIAILTGLLALSLFTQPAQSAGPSKEAKAIEYAFCLDVEQKARTSPHFYKAEIIKDCARYRP
jgi:hypothetical protein